MSENRDRREFLYTASSVAGLIGLSGCISTGKGGEEAQDGPSTRDGGKSGRLSPATTLLPSLSWDFETGGRVKSYPTVVEGTLYSGSWDGYLYAIEGESDDDQSRSYQADNWSMAGYDYANRSAPATEGPGEGSSLKWEFQTKDGVDNGAVHGQPAVVDGRVYVGAGDDFFYCVDEETGEERWSYEVSGVVASSACVINESVFFASSAGKMEGPGTIYRLNAEDGEHEMSISHDEYVATSPKVLDGLLYYGVWDDTYYAVDAETGDEVWRFESDDVFCDITPAIDEDGGVLYIGSEDKKMYALDKDTGDKLWEYGTDGFIISSPAFAEDTVFFGSADENVYAIDADTGEERWVFETGGPVFSSPAYRDGLVYVGSGDGHLYAVDASTGEMVWFYGTEGFVYSSPVVTEDTVYFGSNDQKLYAVENEASDDESYREYREQIEKRKQEIEDERYDPEEKEAEIMEHYYER